METNPRAVDDACLEKNEIANFRDEDDTKTTVSESACDDVSDSLIRLPDVRNTLTSKAARFTPPSKIKVSPPPLPPKPSFARASSLQNLVAPSLQQSVSSPPLPPPPLRPLPPPPSSIRRVNIPSTDGTKPPPRPTSPKPFDVSHLTGSILTPPSAPVPPPKSIDACLNPLPLPTSRIRSQTPAAVNLNDLAYATQSSLVPSIAPPPLQPPSRPPPAVPKSRKGSLDIVPVTNSSGDGIADTDGITSCAPTMFEDQSFFDGSAVLPPDPLTTSDGDTVRQPGRDTCGNLTDTPNQSITTEPTPSFRYPLPPPPYAAPDYPLASRFYPVHAQLNAAGKSSYPLLQLSYESAEDVNIGSAVLSKTRIKDMYIPSSVRAPPISWRLYKKAEPGLEVWAVLREYLTNVSLKSRGKTRALQLLTGYVVGACLESYDVGIALLSEIVLRMRGTERSERDGSVFTLLINIAAHVSFVQRVAWPSVEQVTRRAFSNVVEDMHGRQDDDVMWKRALHCFLILCKSSNLPPSSDISSRCIVALALHARDLYHADIDHVLITNGLCQRLRYSTTDLGSASPLNNEVLDDIGGPDIICSLFTDTTSISARLCLFSIIFDIAVSGALSETPEDDMVGSQDHVTAFRSIFDANDMADLLVHAFRVGPPRSFVIDTIRLLLFKPLSKQFYTEILEPSLAEIPTSSCPDFQRRNDNMMGQKELNQKVSVVKNSISKYVNSIGTIIKVLDKPLCLRILQQLERMAQKQFDRRVHLENLRHPREWRLLYNLEHCVQRYLYSRTSEHAMPWEDVLSSMHKVVASMTSDRVSSHGIIRMIELIIEFFVIKLPFSQQKTSCNFSTCSDSIIRLFLRGQVVVPHQLLAQTDSAIFTLLLIASRQCPSLKRVSECRQCLIEFLGALKERVHLLDDFKDDDDAAVAYRAREIASKFTDIQSQRQSRS